MTSYNNIWQYLKISYNNKQYQKICQYLTISDNIEQYITTSYILQYLTIP